MSGALLVQHAGGYFAPDLAHPGDFHRPLFLLMPKLGEWKIASAACMITVRAIAGGMRRVYDRFFGPAAGSFYALAFVTLCGYNRANHGTCQKCLTLPPTLAACCYLSSAR